MARTLVLLRHGESEWNLKNLFTGWYDCDLTPKGEAQAAAGGRLMAERSVRHDPRYAALPPEVVPDTECLADVVARMLPYWYDVIVPDLGAGHAVLVAAHGNSLRALVKHLDGISDADITELKIPTGEPLVYELGDDYRPVEAKPVEERYLRSPEEVREAAEAVARQAEAGAAPEPDDPGDARAERVRG